MAIKLSDYIATYLKEHYHIKHFFMVSGGGAMHLNDSLGRIIPYTANHHEQACAFSAEGYARVYGELALVNVTTGPGGLNCLNGVFGQWCDSVPVLYLSGQVKLATTLASIPHVPLRQLGDQEVDIISIVRPITKYAFMLSNPLDVRYHIDKAIYLATQDRKGPVWLDIPIDIQASMIEEDSLRAFCPSEFAQDMQHDEAIDARYLAMHSALDAPTPTLNASLLNATKPIASSNMTKTHHATSSMASLSIPPLLTGATLSQALSNALFALHQAKAPLIVAGHGIRIANQVDILSLLLDILKIPIVTTFNGMDVIADNHPCYIGRIGSLGQRAGNFALQNATCIIFLGTRNNIRQTSYNYENYAKNAYKIVIDIDAYELIKPNLTPDMPICANLCEVMPLLLRLATPLNRPSWLAFCQHLRKKYSPLEQKQTARIEPYFFMRSLTSMLDDSDIIVLANGSACVCGFAQAIVKSHQRYILNSGNASMGFALPSAIGSYYASRGRNVICIEGDGSIMMNLQELQTLKSTNIPIKLFILNNNGYSSIRQTQRNFFHGRMVGSGVDSGVEVPDFCALGKAFGLEVMRINKREGLKSTLASVLACTDAMLIEVMLEQEYAFIPKLSAKTLPDGSMVSPSLEDMSPFLPPEEMAQNLFKG